MKRQFLSTALLAAYALGAVMATAALDSAEAAQPYWCLCKGEKKRFLASTRYCEHQYKVQSCSAAQFADFNRQACKANGCRVVLH